MITNTIVGSKLIYTCCHILDALMDTILAFVDICNTAFKVLIMSPEKTPLTIFLALVEFEGDQTTDVEFIGLGLTAVVARDWFS